ncbi:uncharacterized protein [Drosophila kikkawai]|uniref:PI-PLC X domain-containing protein 3 n=1 Tax=Drosophila kikkawai TaxID=30033 RepID=A0A6P4IYL7_DROKI|nr:uncharacterized protein LOC108078650 [Drosophila kikkawai]
MKTKILILLPLVQSILLFGFLKASCPVYLTISPNGKALYDSSLEVNWGPDCYGPPQWIGIYAQDPTISNFQPELLIPRVAIVNKTGKIITQIKLGKLHFPGGWNRQDTSDPPATRYPTGKCLPHYVASYNGTELLTVDCLKIQPNWMAQNKDVSRMPLKNMFLPGTHASGAVVNRTSKSVLIKDYLQAQLFDVWSQLVFGIRYLDFSVGYKNMATNDDSDNFWLVNENMFLQPLVGVLRDVLRFVKRSGEMVVLDFSSFPIGFYKHPEIYRSLFYLIRRELGDEAYQRNVTTNELCANRNLQDLLRQNRHVMILFPTQELPHPENESNLICPPWLRFSTSFMNMSQTLDYMRLLFSRKPESPVKDDGWIFTAVRSMEQTLNSHKLQTAKERAAVLNPKVNQWLKGPWGNNANVVAMDYFSNTNLVDLAIQLNAHKAFLMANEDYVNLEILNLC